MVSLPRSSRWTHPEMQMATKKTSSKTPATAVTSPVTPIAKAVRTSSRPKATVIAPAAPAAKAAAVRRRVKATPQPASSVVAGAAIPSNTSKQARLVTMLMRGHGATIAQMMKLTEWQAHTVRGTISAVLRKKLGLTVTCETSADSSTPRYRIVDGMSA